MVYSGRIGTSKRPRGGSRAERSGLGFGRGRARCVTGQIGTRGVRPASMVDMNESLILKNGLPWRVGIVPSARRTSVSRQRAGLARINPLASSGKMVVMREQSIMQRVQLEASRRGYRLFRNNVGCLPDARGVPVRYGLCPGSSDLIGWRPLTITPDMVGHTVAQFVAVEVKGPAGKATPEQLRFLDAVTSAGGVALIARGEGQLP